MKNSGKSLERLVAAIEQNLVPEEFEVQLNKRVFNDDGVQIAEFDIMISGNIGSSSMRWLIECRDRPSEGAAPGSWIEQLKGRRRRFNFDKVFAVSTTGFAPDAKEFAKREGIVLRSVTAVEEIAMDWGVIDFRLTRQAIKLWGLIDCDVIGVDQLELMREITLEKKKPTKINFPGTSEHFNIEQFILNKMQGSNLFPRPDRDEDFDLIFEFAPDVLLYFEEARHLRVRNLKIPIILRIEHFYTKTLAGNIYSEADKIIGQEVAFRFDTPQGVISYSGYVLKKPDGSIDVKLDRHYELTPC